MEEIHKGDIQLPEFQRDWTWDDYRIRGIIASITQAYPIGVIMQLEYGNENIRFKYRTIEGAERSAEKKPNFLVLDGQQRLTAIYRAAYSESPVTTKNDKGKTTQRYYYLDMNKCLDANADRIDAVISVAEDRRIKPFPGNTALDLSTQELEYENEMFPLNIIFSSDEREDWGDGYKKYYSYSQEAIDKYKLFLKNVIRVVSDYKLPVITLTKDTPREAVCKIFENVNTGGVTLTVFELVTASFAAYLDLRKEWEECRKIIRGENGRLMTDVMDGVNETAFLTALTLYTTYMDRSKDTSCKKKDVLSLKLDDYHNNKSKILEGFKMARNFLLNQCIFFSKNLPYTTQLIPLAAICAVIGISEFSKDRTMKILSSWYWCGVLGEMYGGSTDTRFANDIEDVTAAIRGEGTVIRTVNSAFFSSTRLLSLQTRNSAAYNGIIALLYQAGCRDFVKWTAMSTENMDETVDIHHIFPKAYCEGRNYPKDKWNSILNKTPLLPATNRSIGGNAPSKYSEQIMRNAGITIDVLRERMEADLIDFDSFIHDDFDTYFIARAKKFLVLIESAMGKKITDRDSEETVKQFGCSLADDAR